MAEGGDIPSLKDGSDADFEFTCTPCEEGSIREEAVKYCPECQEYLCTTCSTHHGRQKATRAHKLLDRDDAKKGSLVAKTKCSYHPDREIEMYCRTHDMVYCVMCIATEHRSCDGVNRIEDEPKSCVNQTEINRLLDETKIETERIRALAIKQKKNKTSLDDQRNDIEEKLQDVETTLIEHIRKLKTENSHSLDESYAKITDELESEISISTKTVQNLENTSKQLQSVAGKSADMDAVQKFVQMKLMKKTVTEAKKLHANNESNGTKSVCFTENTDLVTSVMEAVALGKVRTEVEDKKPPKPVQHKIKSKKEINVRMASDKHECVISDVCQLPGGMILLTDERNNKVKRLDMNYRMKDHCDLVAVPTGICCVDQNEVAVKMANHKLQFISVASSLPKTRCVTIQCGDYYGIALYSKQLWISTGYGVDVYDTRGTRIKSIYKDPNGKAIFKLYALHMTVSDNKVIITNYSDGAVCLDKDAKVIMELRDKRLESTRGVCVSDDGTVFVCGYNSHNVVMFSSDGKCLGELITADAGLKSPLSLCYDGKKHCIIITCEMSEGSDVIHVVDLGV